MLCKIGDVGIIGWIIHGSYLLTVALAGREKLIVGQRTIAKKQA
jgi:hypothetical protein